MAGRVIFWFITLDPGDDRSFYIIAAILVAVAIGALAWVVTHNGDG